MTTPARVIPLRERFPVQETPQQTRLNTIRNRPKTKISASQRDYMQRQISVMATAGAEESDILEFLRTEGVSVPDPVAPQQMQEKATGSVIGRTANYIGNLSQHALQGVTFGFGDEAVGALTGILTGEGARGGIEAYRREMDAWGKDHRVASIGSELLGGLVSGGAISRGVGMAVGSAATKLAAPTIAQRMGRAMLEGGAMGSAFGAGKAEGGISERAKSALIGGAFGTALGGTIAPVGRILGSVMRPVARGATRGLKSIQEHFPGIGSPEMGARELLVRALAQDGINLSQARGIVLNQIRAGTTPTLADIGGDATLGLARQAVSLRGAPKQKLVELFSQRQAEQGERLTTSMFNRIFRGNKLGLRNAYAASDDLQAFRSAESAPLYANAFAETATITPRMREILQHPKFQQAWKIGKNITQDEDLAGIGHGLEVPSLPKSVTPQQRAQILSQVGGNQQAANAFIQKLEASNAGALTELPVRGLDYMKRGLDRVIEQGYKKKSLDARSAQTLRSMLDEVLEEVDGQVASYGQARGIFRGASETMAAIDTGREFIKKAPEIVAREIQALHPGQRDFYRLGAAQTLYEDVMRSPDELKDVARQYFGGTLFGKRDNLVSQRLRALFVDSPEIADDFMRQVAAEARLSHTSRTVGGGMGGRLRQETAEGIEGSVPPGARGTARLFVGQMAIGAINRSRTGWAQDVSDELATLFAKGLDDPNALLSLLDNLEVSGQTLARRAAAGSKVATVTGQIAGSVFR